MALTPGTRLGFDEVTAQIGEGGMGQVYRARDTKLNRDVALKILPDAFASDPDRLARFTREAQTLASLNHPNIAQIFGLEQAGEVHALAMELVVGDDLSQRIANGPIPIDDALPIAKQIADALEAAHEQGIIHRDLKPANIKLKGARGTFSQRLVGTPPPQVGPTRRKTAASSVGSQPRLTGDVVAKILDFGLAKVCAPDSAGPDLSHAPTMTSTGTRIRSWSRSASSGMRGSSAATT